MSKLAHSNQATMDKIERDQIAREARGDDEPRGHTPGPWTIGAEYPAPAGGKDVEINAKDHGALALVVVEMESGERPEELAANARLIAKAPSMLTALEQIEQQLDYGQSDAALKIARAILNGMKGE